MRRYPASRAKRQLPRRSVSSAAKSSVRGSRSARGGRARYSNHRTPRRGSRRARESTSNSVSQRPQSYVSSSPLQRRNGGFEAQASESSHSQAAIADSRSDDIDDDPLSETIMALEMRKDIIGCSCYVARDETLFLMEDIPLGTLDLVSQLRLFVQPTTIVLSNREQDDTVKVFDPQCSSDAGDSASDSSSLPFSLDFRSPGEFDYESATVKLINLEIGGFSGPRVAFAVPGDAGGVDDHGYTGHQARMMRLSALVSTEGRVSVGCSGAVIAYLQRRRAAAYLPGDPAADALFRVSVVSMFTLKDYMYVNVDTVLSLQVLQLESHPCAHNQGPTKSSSGSKEGLSVFGLFQHLAKSPQGRIALKQLFLRPVVDIDRINERLEAVNIFSRPENHDIFGTLRKHMGGIKFVKSLLSNLRKGASSGSGQVGRVTNRIWSGLESFAFHSTQVYNSLGEIIGIEYLRIASTFADRFRMQDIVETGQRIIQTIDFDASVEQLRTAVRRGVDAEFDERKRTYQGIDDLLQTVAQALKRDIPLGLPQDPKAVYVPQIGFLIALPKDEEAGTALWEGALDDQIWEKMFASDDLVYYKDDKMRGMDEHFGDVFTEICDREIEIVHDLALEVLKFEESLLAASEACADLDYLLALAEGAKRYNLCRPRMTQDNVLQIEGGRHILQELTVPAVIASDTNIAASSSARENSSRMTPSAFSSLPPPPAGPSMLVLTGPNFSGKSIYLKQAALITYLAHIGSFVPATSAVVGITDAILLRVATRESVSRSQSAFIVDLQQVSCALNVATNRSLLVIDEFGKGTAACDGAGLACALLEHLLKPDDANRPKVLAATHFHEIFRADAFRSNDNVQFAHMEIRLDTETAIGRQHATYLYNLVPGLSCDSFGTVCASLNGIADEVVRRAEESTIMQAEGDDLTVAFAMLGTDESRELKKAERVAREFLASDIVGDPRALIEDVLGGSNDEIEIVDEVAME